jgi:hypothetical protein
VRRDDGRPSRNRRTRPRIARARPRRRLPCLRPDHGRRPRGRGRGAGGHRPRDPLHLTFAAAMRCRGVRGSAGAAPPVSCRAARGAPHVPSPGPSRARPAYVMAAPARRTGGGQVRAPTPLCATEQRSPALTAPALAAPPCANQHRGRRCSDPCNALPIGDPSVAQRCNRDRGWRTRAFRNCITRASRSSPGLLHDLRVAARSTPLRDRSLAPQLIGTSNPPWSPKRAPN